MIGHGIRFWHSIVVRFSLFITGLLVLVILLSGYLVFQKSSKVIIAAGKDQIRHSAELAELSFSALLSEVANDIALISSEQAVQNFANEDPNTEDGIHLVQLLFSNILMNKPNYFQIRFIDSSGQEVVRFDKIADSIFAINQSELQYKGDRDYFQEAMEIEHGEYYFSRINLNEEYGVISDPPIPTLRAASPLINSNQIKVGAVVVNIDLSSFYSELTRISNSSIHFHLIDESNQYLYTPSHHKEFGIQRGSGFTFTDDFGLDITSQKPGESSFSDKQGRQYLCHISILEFFKGQRRVYLVAALDESILLQSARSVRKESLKSLAIVCMITLFLSFLFTRLFSRQINRITAAISNYDDSHKIQDIPIDRRDEIGLLARSFMAMREKIEDTLKNLNTALEEEKKSRTQRDQLLQNMSHELRTPLHTIQGLTELLKKNKPNPAQVPIISSLHRSVQNLTGLVYDVLDHQKLVEGRLSLKMQPCNIGLVIEEIHQNYQYEALKKGLEFKFKCDDIFKIQKYIMDPLRLSQILTNLVVNAIKYTEQGGIMMEARCISDPDHSYLEVLVTDTGTGIDEESLLRINEGGMEERPAISGRYGSYGLGLSIVRQLVSLLEGHFEANSTVNVGSCFKISIPIIGALTDDDSSIQIDSDNILPSLGKTKVVMQVDDDVSSLEMFSYILGSDQFELFQYSSYEQMTEEIETVEPQIIVADLMINQKNYAEELIKQIKNNRISCSVIVVSAQEIQQSRKISPYAFQKPFDPNLLLDQIYMILGEDQYEKPSFKYLYHNYDGNKEKIKRALGFIESEFLTFVKKLKTLQSTPNLDQWMGISHKLITHVRSVKLAKIEKIIARPDELPDESSLTYLIQSICYCLCAIRMEKWINSID